MNHSAPYSVRSLSFLLFVVCFAMILFELLLTRVFAVTLFATQAHLVLGLALLGISLGAMLHYLKPGMVVPDNLPPRLHYIPSGMALSLVVAMWCAVTFPVLTESNSVIVGYNQRAGMADELIRPGWFLALMTVVTVPFLLAGLAISASFQLRREAAGRLYAFDLIGGALGALAFIPAIYLAGGPNAVFFCALVAASGGVPWLRRAGRSSQVFTAIIVVGCATGLLASFSGASLLSVHYAAGFPEYNVKYQKWTPLTRLAIHRDPLDEDRDLMMLDNASVSQIITTPGQRRRLRRDNTRSLVYELMGRPGRAAILAASAGPEVAAAQEFGFKDIDAIDIAGEIFDIIATRYHDSPVNPFLQSGVHRVMADGRAAVLHSHHPYDVIQMVHANLWSVAGMISNAWSPSLLGTVEAFETYLERISPDGVISFAKGPETDWLVASATEALLRRGATHPGRHIALIGGSGRVMLVRPRPWTEEEWNRLLRILDSRGASRYQILRDPFNPLAFTSRGVPVPRYAVMTDDRPHAETFQRVKETVAAILRGDADYRSDYIPVVYRSILVQFVYVVLVGLFLILVPWIFWRRRNPHVQVGIPLGYIACLGYGYLAIEIVLIQRLVLFIGHPTYALTTVLGSMLFFSGLGSLYSERFDIARQVRVLRRILLAAFFLALITGLVVPGLLLEYAHGAHPLSRALLAAISLAPAAFVMGMPFPLGLRYLTRSADTLVPWAWAINGWMSIVAGLGTVIISRIAGFSTALIVGALAYTLGFAITFLFDRAHKVNAT